VKKTNKTKNQKTTPKVSTAPAKKARRHSFTPQARQEILATATKEGLTAKQVQKKYGISMVTFYLWRKKAGLSGQRGDVAKGVGKPKTTAIPADLQKRVRAEVQSAMDQLVREEVENYLRTTLSALAKR